MAPVPPNTTNRLKVLYSGPFGTHTMLFHGVTGVSQADLVAAAAAVITEMVNVTWDGTSFTSAEYVPAGGTVSTPATWTPITRTGGSTPSAATAPSTFLQWGARDPAGVRTKLYLFETATSPTPDMRYQFAESTTLAAITTALQANDGIIGSVAGGVLTWKSYVNVGQNDYLTHRARGG